MKVQPIRPISNVKRDAPKMTIERAIEFIKLHSDDSTDISTIVELGKQNDIPSFLYDKNGKLT